MKNGKQPEGRQIEGRQIEVGRLVVTFDWMAWQKMFAWVKEAPGEVSGLGCGALSDGKFIVRDVLLLEQESSAGSTELNSDDVAKLVEELLEANRIDDIHALKVWWHSHGSMEPFWSATDYETIDRIGKNADWLLSIVVNRNEKYRCRLDMRRPIEMYIDDVAVKVADPPESVLEKRLEKVKEVLKQADRPVADRLEDARRVLSAEYDLDDEVLAALKEEFHKKVKAPPARIVYGNVYGEGFVGGDWRENWRGDWRGDWKRDWRQPGAWFRRYPIYSGSAEEKEEEGNDADDIVVFGKGITVSLDEEAEQLAAKLVAVPASDLRLLYRKAAGVDDQAVVVWNKYGVRHSSKVVRDAVRDLLNKLESGGEQ